MVVTTNQSARQLRGPAQRATVVPRHEGGATVPPGLANWLDVDGQSVKGVPGSREQQPGGTAPAAASITRTTAVRPAPPGPSTPRSLLLRRVTCPSLARKNRQNRGNRQTRLHRHHAVGFSVARARCLLDPDPASDLPHVLLQPPAQAPRAHTLAIACDLQGTSWGTGRDTGGGTAHGHC